MTMQGPRCHYCPNEAEAECPTCGRLYCAEHGDDVCLRCLSPESAVPSPLIYRGSVLALGIASLVAVFLIVRPPESDSRSAAPLVVGTSTPGAASTATPTRPPSVTATRSVTPTAAASATPEPPTPAANPTPAVRTHTVAPNQTLSEIAGLYGTTVAALHAANPGITPETLQVGAVLTIPAAAQ